MSTPILAFALMLGIGVSACAQKAKVDRAFSDSARQAQLGVTDLDSATDTGEVGPSALPFRVERTGPLCVYSRVVGSGEGGAATASGTGVGGVVGVDGPCMDRARSGDALPLVADRASQPDPGRADVNRADGDPGGNAVGGESGGSSVGPEPTGDASGVCRGSPCGGPGVRCGVEERSESCAWIGAAAVCVVVAGGIVAFG
jgi:hypothetical protein